MKKLLKSEVYGCRALFTGPTDGLKMAEKSKFFVTVHAQYMNSSLYLPLRVQQKNKKNTPQDSAENTEFKRAQSRMKFP